MKRPKKPTKNVFGSTPELRAHVSRGDLPKLPWIYAIGYDNNIPRVLHKRQEPDAVCTVTAHSMDRIGDSQCEAKAPNFEHAGSLQHTLRDDVVRGNKVRAAVQKRCRRRDCSGTKSVAVDQPSTIAPACSQYGATHVPQAANAFAEIEFRGRLSVWASAVLPALRDIPIWVERQFSLWRGQGLKILQMRSNAARREANDQGYN